MATAAATAPAAAAPAAPAAAKTVKKATKAPAGKKTTAPKGAKGAKGAKGVKKAKKETKKYVIDCTQPVNDNILDAGAFEKFLVDHIKVAGKTSNLGNNVSVTRDQARLTVTANLPFSKRYVKYLTKKFLKKSQLKDFMHVIANSKNSYEIRYYKVDSGEGDEDAE